MENIVSFDRRIRSAEVYQKVIRVNQLLETGEASNTSEAVKMAGISRSVYYKYKNAVFRIQKRKRAPL